MSYDPAINLVHHSIQMGRFGTNPYGEPMYRLVFGPSRRQLVCGDWGSGYEAKWKIKYREAREHWVLEQWRSAEEYGGRPEAWPQILGPYPTRGEYDIIHAFLEGEPTSSQVEKLITWSKFGRENVSFGDTFEGIREQENKRRAAVSANCEDLIRNKLPAFGVRPFAAHGGSRGDKTWKPLKTAEELGLPTKGGMRTGKKVNKLIEAANAA